MRCLDQLRPVALLLLRIAMGVIFIFHGYPKLIADPHRYADLFARAALPFPISYLAGTVEFFGGCLLLVGLFTRVAALLLAADMAMAIWKFHLGRGILAVGDYEFPLALTVAAFALATIGAGAVSLDRAVFHEGAGGAKTVRGKSAVRAGS